jgi:GAF domain-containing protein
MSASQSRRERPGDAERYRVLLEIGHEIAATLGEDDLYEAIHRETAKAVETAGFYISLYDQSRDMGRVVYYADQGVARRIDVAFRGSDSKVIRSQKAALEIDGIADRSLVVLGDQGSGVTRSAVTAPMIHHGRVLGAISAQSYEPRAYTEDDLHLLQGIADIAAVALENAQQFKELARRRREAEMIEEIGRALASELDPEMVLGKVVDAALSVLDVDGASVWLTDARAGLVCRVADSRGEVLLPKGIEWNIEGEIERVPVDQRG